MTRLFRVINRARHNSLVLAHDEPDAKQVMQQANHVKDAKNAVVHGDQSDFFLVRHGGETLKKLMEADVRGICGQKIPSGEWICNKLGK